MSEHPTVTPFDFGDLPDMLTQAEALWHLTALSYTYALHQGYLTLMDEPDRKAAWNIGKAAELLERSIRRAYGAGQAAFLVALARQKAREGVERHRAAQDAAAKQEVQP